MLKLMIVDDSEVIREKIQMVTDGQDVQFVGDASNGLEAVKQFRELKPDVITLDITMPVMDGIDTIKRIVEIDPDVRILVVSALADKATLIQAMTLGATGYLCKPFSDVELEDALYELIEDLL